MSQARGAATDIADGIWAIDLGFLGKRGVIAAYLVAADGELGLIETGPASTLPNLLAGIRAAGFAPEDIRQVLVTHIHLDHSGGAGVLARQFPELTVHVHPIGLPHLIDPSRLVGSAARLYGERMDELWGEVVPLPAERVVPMGDGESIAVAERQIVALDTPGHASHHLSFWDDMSGTVFTGDVGGVRIQGAGYVCPPTPPPDLDPDAWVTSVERLRALGARRCCPTHFGAFDDVERHLKHLIPNLDILRDLAAEVLAAGGDVDDLTARIHALYRAELGDASADDLDRLEAACPSYVAAPGLMRLLTRPQ